MRVQLRVLLMFFGALALHLPRVGLWTPYPDEVNYGLTARNLWQPVVHYVPSPQPIPEHLSAKRPLFLYLVSIAQRLGADLVSSGRLISAILGAAIVPAACGLLRERSPRVATAGSLALLLLYPLNIFSGLARPETAHLLAFLVGSIFLLRWERHCRPGHLVAAAVCLGVGVWLKEVGLAYILAAAGYVLLTRLRTRAAPPRRGGLASLAVLTIILLPLVVIGQLHSDGSDGLLFEMFKPWQVNSPDLSLSASARVLMANLAGMLGVPGHLRTTLGLLFLAVCLYFLVRGLMRRSQLAILVFSYLVVALPFFTWFSKKFEYYLLPAGALLLLLCVSELPQAWRRLANDQGSTTRRQWPRGRSILDGGALVAFGLLLALNLFQDSDLFLSRGPYDFQRQFVAACSRRETIAAAEYRTLSWLSDRQERGGPKVLPLFFDEYYSIDWPLVKDARTDAVVLLDFYADVLSGRFPTEWQGVNRLFPVRERFGQLLVLRRGARVTLGTER